MSQLFLIVLFIFTPLLLADELDVIEVEATKDIGRFTFSDSFDISTNELESNSTGLVAPALSKVPGVIPNQNGGPGGRVSFFVRGTESRHVTFTLDGLKINDASNVDRQFDAAFMTSPFLKGVVIHKGPQAVLFGSDAMGGVVELQTRKGDNAPETRILLNGGSFGTIDATLSSDWRKTDHRGTLTLTRFHTDGISRLNKKRFNADEKDSADITQVTSSSVHHWAQKVETEFLVSYVDGDSEQDGFGVDTKNDRSLSDQYILQQKTNLELNKKQIISLRNGLSRHQRFIKSEGSATESYSGNLYQNELIHRSEFSKLGLLTGLTNEKETNHSDNLDKKFELNSLFMQSAYKWDQLKFQAGGRYDHHSRYGSFVTGSGGVSYEFSHQSLALQYSQGFKAPSLYQLYGPDAFGSPVGNEDLVPERNHSWEASWKLKSSEMDGGITFFQNRLSNLISYTNAGYINQGRFIAEGVELFSKIKLEKFEILPSFTHQNFRHEKSTVLRRPYNLASLNFSYFPEESIELNFTPRWFSSRKDIDEDGDNVKLNGYYVVDIAIRKTWINDAIGLQIKNIFDREYEELYGYSIMPLSIFGHVEHRF